MHLYSDDIVLLCDRHEGHKVEMDSTETGVGLVMIDSDHMYMDRLSMLIEVFHEESLLF